MKFPFKEKQIGKQLFLREFSANVDEMDLIWHEDIFPYLGKIIKKI